MKYNQNNYLNLYLSIKNFKRFFKVGWFSVYISTKMCFNIFIGDFTYEKIKKKN